MAAFVGNERVKFRRALLHFVRDLRAGDPTKLASDDAFIECVDRASAQCLPNLDPDRLMAPPPSSDPLASPSSSSSSLALPSPSPTAPSSAPFQFAGSVSALLEHIAAEPYYSGQVQHHRVLPARGGSFRPLPAWVPPPLRQALLDSKGIAQLYEHQAKALADLHDGHHVVVSTSTASGKSLVFNIPVLTALLESGGAARTLFIYPTKALGQDQSRSLRELIGAHASLAFVRAATFDGDTPSSARADLIASTHIFLSNPDMLHCTILPQHKKWAHVLAALRYVVLDEVHTYAGVFGTHVGHVLRRLRRLCAHYGNTGLQFICCSATIGNPVEHTVALTGVPAASVRLSSIDGSPMGAKHFVLWQPPPAASAGPRNSPSRAILDAVHLMVTLILANVRTLMFVGHRKGVEYITSLVHRALGAHVPRPSELVRSYRAGYAAAVRRGVEAQLFGGQLRGVVATSALELGVDVGALDAVIHVSFPPSVASLWQQAGRAGRRHGESLSLLVADAHPADAYVMEHPEFVFEGGGEAVQIDPLNPFVLERHLDCAACELPIDCEADAAFFGAEIEGLVSDKLVPFDAHGKAGFRWDPRREPPRFSLRVIEEDVFVIVEANTRAVVEEMEYSRALVTVYPGAVFFHQGASFVVIDMALASDTKKEAVVLVDRRDVNYITFARDVKHVDPLQTLESKAVCGNVMAVYGHVKVSVAILGYKKVLPFTNAQPEFIEYAQGTIPPFFTDTTAAWISISLQVQTHLARRKLNAHLGCHALVHTLSHMIPLFVRCQPGDILGECLSPLEHRIREPRILLYDFNRGGVGLALKVYDSIYDLLHRTLDLIARCPCENGCLKCVWSLRCTEHNDAVCKAAAVMLLRLLLDQDLLDPPEAATGVVVPHSLVSPRDALFLQSPSKKH